MKRYSQEEIIELLEKAGQIGYSLETGSVLEGLTLAELEQIVHSRTV